MRAETPEDHFQGMLRRLEGLWARGVKWPPEQRQLIAEVLEELGTTVEELNVATEELRQQNEELIASAEAVGAERKRYRELFDLAPEAYLVTDLDGIIQEANTAAARQLNVEAALLVGKPMVMFLSRQDRKLFHVRLDRPDAEEPRSDWEIRVQPRGRQAFPATVHRTAATNFKGDVVGWRWQLHDISDRKRAAQEEAAKLRQYGERMAELEKTKSEFLKLASHELRGPLTVVGGYLSMLEEGSLPPHEWQHGFAMLSAKVEQMNLLINEMLETARLEEGGAITNLEPVDLRDIVQRAVKTMEPLARGQPIPVAMPDDAVGVLADPTRLETILRNLIDNAIKYSRDTPCVRCEVSVRGDIVEVSIEDKGLGIARDDIPKLFTRFGRLVTPDNSHISGTGLGLYVSLELARLHGGEITVSSELGRGSTFTLRLPLATPAASSA